MTTGKYESLRAAIDAGVREGVRRAIEEHRRAGRSIYVWRDGQVVEIPPEEIRAVPKAGESAAPYEGHPES